MVADLRSLYERAPARPLVLDPELTRMVWDLTRDVEQFDSLLEHQRHALKQRATDPLSAERQWTKLRAEVGRIMTKVNAVVDEIALPVTDS